MKCRTLTILLSVVLLAFMVSSVSASITVPTTTYFGLPDYGTYISFNENTTVTSLVLTGDTVTIDDYVLSAQYSNMTINQFFEGNYLLISISSPETSTTIITVNGAENGYTRKPQASFYPSVFYLETFTASTYTLEITHTDPLVCTIRFPSPMFSATFDNLFTNAYAALLLYSIVPIIVGLFLLLTAIQGEVSKELVLASIIGLIAYVIVVVVTLPIFFSLQSV